MTRQCPFQCAPQIDRGSSACVRAALSFSSKRLNAEAQRHGVTLALRPPYALSLASDNGPPRSASRPPSAVLWDPPLFRSKARVLRCVFVLLARLARACQHSPAAYPALRVHTNTQQQRKEEQVSAGFTGTRVPVQKYVLEAPGTCAVLKKGAEWTSELLVAGMYVSSICVPSTRVLTRL